MKDGVLCRGTTPNGELVCQVVLLAHERWEVFGPLHNDNRHQGRDRTLSLICGRFFWYVKFTIHIYPSNTRKVDIIQWVPRCDRCIRQKTSPTTEHKLENMTAPMKMV